MMGKKTETVRPALHVNRLAFSADHLRGAIALARDYLDAVDQEQMQGTNLGHLHMAVEMLYDAVNDLAAAIMEA
jgi:hypothetical protein